MKTADEEWWIAEAGEYVLGTLRHSERALFERFIERDKDIQSLVNYWENCFYPLNNLTPTIEPPGIVWTNIVQQIESLESEKTSADQSATPAATKDTTPHRELTVDEQRNIRPHVLLRTLTSLALAASLAMGIYLLFSLQQTQSPAAPEYDRVAVLAGAEGDGLWTISADSGSNRIRVIALTPPPAGDEKDYQLWQIKPDNAGVASVGLLSGKSGEIRHYDLTHPLSGSVAFAVSLEPAGGSPNPVPSGPVLYSGTITALESSI